MAIKTFSVSEVLTASDVNTYLMKQAVITCTSSTRPSSPVDGMMIYQTDTDNTWSYDGATWLPSTGLQPIKPTSATNGTVTGNITTFSNVSSVTINGVFTANYSRYRVEIAVSNNAGTSAYARTRLTSGGTERSTSYVSKSIWTNMGSASATWNDYDAPSDSYSIGAVGASTYPSLISFDINYPANATYQTIVTGTSTGTQVGVANYMALIGGIHQVAQAHDGLKLYMATGQNLTGEIQIYGYR